MGEREPEQRGAGVALAAHEEAQEPHASGPGVDAFQLYKVNGQWKIFQLTDTRRKDPCVIPEAVRKKHQ